MCLFKLIPTIDEPVNRGVGPYESHSLSFVFMYTRLSDARAAGATGGEPRVV